MFRSSISKQVDRNLLSSVQSAKFRVVTTSSLRIEFWKALALAFFVSGCGGRIETNGSPDSGAATGNSDVDVCTTDSDCITCPWLSVPSSTDQCGSTMTCEFGNAVTLRRCLANRAGWYSVCNDGADRVPGSVDCEPGNCSNRVHRPLLVCRPLVHRLSRVCRRSMQHRPSE
jgi:hypothetical protein